MAQLANVGDLVSIQVIMDSEANIVEGMADLFCNHLVTPIATIVGETPTVATVDRQVADLKRILCGLTAKENAIAAVIAAVTKKEAADLGISPDVVCKCLACECKKDC